MSSGISGSASAIRLSRKQDGRGGAPGGWDDRIILCIARAAPRAFLTGLRVTVHQLGPLLLRPKEACQAMGLGHARNGQDENQGSAGGKHRVQHRRSSASVGARRSMQSSLARARGREGHDAAKRHVVWPRCLRCMTTNSGPIREFRRIVDRGDIKTGCDYRTLPNWPRSGQQMGQGGPGGALVDTAVSSVAMG